MVFSQYKSYLFFIYMAEIIKKSLEAYDFGITIALILAPEEKGSGY